MIGYPHYAFGFAVLSAFTDVFTSSARQWWTALTEREEARIDSQCHDCREIRSEQVTNALDLISARKQKGSSAALRRTVLAKEQRQLAQRLKDHLENDPDSHPVAPLPLLRPVAHVDLASESHPISDPSPAAGSDSNSNPRRLNPDSGSDSDRGSQGDEPHPVAFGMQASLVVDGTEPCRVRNGNYAAEVGDLVIVRLDEPEHGIPWAVARVLKLSRKLTVQWFHRNARSQTYVPLWYTAKGKMVKAKNPRYKQKPYKDKVSMSSIVDWKFSLTKCGKVPVSVLETISTNRLVDWVYSPSI